MKYFALAGNPNCGKTTLFNSLTGSTAHVGNWAGVTVDKREGQYKKLDEVINIVDLPGIYSLSPYTPEEVVSRNYILDEKPSCIINLIDATNLERNLYLTTQILEIDVPVVCALNMSDLVKKNGDKIDVEALSKKLGVPVVEVSALKETGLDEMMKVAYEESKKTREGKTILENKDLMHLINDVRIAFKGQKVENPLFHAVKLVEMDEIESKAHQDLIPMVEEFKKTFSDETFGDDFEALVADARYKYIAENYSSVLVKNAKAGEENLSKSDKIDKVLTHRIWAIPIFILIMFFIFHLTFSEDLLFINSISGGSAGIKGETAVNIFTGMGYDDSLTENVQAAFDSEDNETTAWVIAAKTEIAAEMIKEGEDADEDAITEEVIGSYVDLYKENGGLDGVDEVVIGVPSPGVFLQSWFGWCTGSIIDLVQGWFDNGGVGDTWYCGLICDGVLNGLDAVCSFIPQIMLMFLFISILEDSGYMARVAFILDRAFRKFGLSGKAFIPMLMGFGCSVPAIMATRTLENEKEKNRTIRLITCFSCGAKAPIWALFAGVAAMAGFMGDIFVFTIYIGGIALAVIYALFMKLFAKDQYVSPFIMELPQYHMPQAKNVAAHCWDKLKHYVKKAATILAGSLVVIWFLQSFSWDFWNGMVDTIDESILADLGRVFQYIFYPLGWSWGAEGWKYSVASITGLVAKEDVVGTMATLGLEEGTITLGVAQVYAYAVFNLLTFPCMAAISTAHSEQKGKEFWVTLAFWLGISYGTSLIIFWIGKLFEIGWYLGLIVLAVLVVAVIFAGKTVVKRNKAAAK